MLAYFARRIVGGVVTLFLAGLILHTLILYMPGGNKDLVTETLNQSDIPIRNPRLLERAYGTDYGLYKPWPFGYLAWLFDPTETTEPIYDGMGAHQTVTKGLDVNFGALHLTGSGVLTGDLGRSVFLEFGQPVADVFGIGLGEFLLLAVLILPISMSVVLVQRCRRPPMPGLPNYPKGRNPLGQCLHPMRVSGV